MPSTSAPRERLLWVKLPSLRVFWPACVYEDYSAATRHTHDLSAVRAAKPTLDVDDRVVFFFGIRHASGASAAVHGTTTVVPNLRFCVVPVDELRTHVWDGADDFGAVCRTYNVDDETISRVQSNSTFQRACADATRFDEDGHSDADARRLFMAFLLAFQPRSTTPHVAPTRVVKDLETTPSRKVEKVVVVEKPVPNKTIETKPIGDTNRSSTRDRRLTTELTAMCWSCMETSGWSTFVKPDGSKIYAMPGVQFSQFRPNETVFEALEDACVKFLQVWAQSDASDAQGTDQLRDSLWNMMLSGGWQTITSANQTMYVVPNTTFDRFIPNVTIFDSKQTAIAKFLVGLGIQQNNERADDNQMQEYDSANAWSGESESEQATSKLDEGDSSDVEISGGDAGSGEGSSSSSDEESENEEDEEDNAPRRLAHTNQETSSQPRRRRVKKAMDVYVPRVVPPFKLRQGQVEQELRQRGWYWKAVPMRKSPDGYMFYKPHCTTKKDSELRINQDCFAGYLQLEAYLKSFEPEIIDKLRHDHEASYGRTTREVEVRKPTRKRAAVTKKARDAEVIEISEDEVDERSQEALVRKVASRGSSRRKQAPAKIKRVFVPSVTRDDIKFGQVWSVLTKKGWFYRPGRFEYDYVRPTGKSKHELIEGTDYFSSRSALEEYLKTSGIWCDVADQIRRDLERKNELLDQSITPIKRKQKVEEDVECTSTPASKRAKLDVAEPVDFLTPPPTDRIKKASVAQISEQIEASYEMEVVTTSTTQISPEATSSKSRKDESASESTPPTRNLNHMFTPSPGAEKVMKRQESNEKSLSAHELARLAIERLTLAHQPAVFAHRESEAKKIEDFCRSCFAEQRGGSLYLSGSPGCGKSALLRSLSEHIGKLHERYGNAPGSVFPVHLNAMGMRDFTQLYCQVAETLTNRKFSDGAEAFEALERATNASAKKSKTLLLVLDEIDALGRTSMENELCRLFELAHRPGQSFILVGIANQIDFTERHLASLRLQLPHIKPQVIVFKPYSFQTISDILMDRLGGLVEAARIVNAHGVAFIARKVAAQSGDVRLALDICRRVLQQKLSELATKEKDEFGPPISLIDIVKTIKVVLEGKSKNNVSSLPRNLQMILFATTRLVAQTNYVVSVPTSSPTDESSTTHKLYRVDDLYECYCDVSHDAGVFKPLTRGEFKLGLETLSSEGMIGASELKKQLLKLLCTPSELLQTFKNDAYFSRLI